MDIAFYNTFYEESQILKVALSQKPLTISIICQRKNSNWLEF